MAAWYDWPRWIMETELTIHGMTCGGCAASIQAALERLEGVERAHVEHERGLARVHSEGSIDAAALVAAVASAGDYRARLGDEGAAPEGADGAAPESLYPLFLIAGFIAGTVALVALASGTWQWPVVMRHFMAGFFLVFAFFKLLDLRGFVDAYRGYDLLARALPAWAWVYPFVEVALGAGYLLDVAPIALNGVTLVLMLLGAAGVLQALRRGTRIRCACLGTALNLPMTKVTLIEDLVMAAMAAGMLWIHLH